MAGDDSISRVVDSRSKGWTHVGLCQRVSYRFSLRVFRFGVDSSVVALHRPAYPPPLTGPLTGTWFVLDRLRTDPTD